MRLRISFQDSLDTITKYDKTRVEFDAYRTRMEEVQMTPKYDMSGQKLRAAQIEMDKARAEYEKKRHDVSVKLELLDENRIKVMRQQLVLLHSATGKFKLTSLGPFFFLKIHFLLTFDYDQIETNGQRHRLSCIRLSIQIFKAGSVRPRDRKLAKYESYDDVI